MNYLNGNSRSLSQVQDSFECRAPFDFISYTPSNLVLHVDRTEQWNIRWPLKSDKAETSIRTGKLTWKIKHPTVSACSLQLQTWVCLSLQRPEICCFGILGDRAEAPRITRAIPLRLEGRGKPTGWEAQVWTPEEKPAVAQPLGSPRHVQSPGYSPPCAHSHSRLEEWAPWAHIISHGWQLPCQH